MMDGDECVRRATRAVQQLTLNAGLGIARCSNQDLRVIVSAMRVPQSRSAYVAVRAMLQASVGAYDE